MASCASTSTLTGAFGGSAHYIVQVVLRKETEWMARQPKARGTKSKARVEAFAELTVKARSGPKKDLQVDFGNVQMARQGSKVLIMKARSREISLSPSFPSPGAFVVVLAACSMLALGT